MDKASEAILALKPVTSLQERARPERMPQFGLVAEDVENVNPDLVVADDQGNLHGLVWGNERDVAQRVPQSTSPD